MPLNLSENRLLDNKSGINSTTLNKFSLNGSSGPLGAVQLSSGPGGPLMHKSGIYVSTEPAGSTQLNRLVLDSNISATPFNEPLTRLRFKIPPGAQTGSSVAPV